MAKIGESTQARVGNDGKSKRSRREQSGDDGKNDDETNGEVGMRQAK